MTPALLDVNVLLALFDRDHTFHRQARTWFTRQADEGWASCAITQSGFVRIMSQPRYAHPVSLPDAWVALHRACNSDAHGFWDCDMSLFDGSIDPTHALTSRTLTDVYLLALAVAHSGRLVTFDRHIPLSAVRDARPEHLVVL